MKNFIVPFMAMTLLMVSDVNAQCAGGAGAGFGFNTNSCDFASQLWAGYCNGGPAIPASAASRGCGLLGGCGGGSGSSCGGGCGGGRIMSHLQGLLSRLHSGGCGGGSCGSGYSYGGYGIQGFGSYAGTMPFGNSAGCGGCASNNTWWYGGGSIGRPSHCGSGGCHIRSALSGGAGCGSSCGGGGRHCGGGLGLFSHFRNRMSYSSWIGGGPLDTYSLVAGYGGFVGSQMDYGCINGACSGDFGAAMPASDCGCSGGAVMQPAMESYSTGGEVYGGESYGGESYSGETYTEPYSSEEQSGSHEAYGAEEQYAPVEELPIEEGPFYESNPIAEVEEIPAPDASADEG